MALFSDQLTRYQELQDRYRQLLSEYDSERARYDGLLNKDATNPELPRLYDEVVGKGEEARHLHEQLVRLQHTLAPRAGVKLSSTY